jgi:hypothetical protein
MLNRQILQKLMNLRIIFIFVTLINIEWKLALLNLKNCIKKKDYHELKLDGLVMTVHKL